MLEKEKPDFVSVCLPAQHTFEATMTVIEAGIPLMSEKPLAYRLEEARELTARAEEKKLFYALILTSATAFPV